MQKWSAGVLALAVLGTFFFLVQTQRHWGIILLLLALIFYGLFANPMKEMHERVFWKKGNNFKRKRKGKKK